MTAIFYNNNLLKLMSVLKYEVSNIWPSININIINSKIKK